MEKTNNRITWIDMARGYGIIFVIFGHIYSGILKSWIYTFHLPLFFFLSGYLFKYEESSAAFLRKRIKSLIIPYLTLGLVVAMVYVYTSKAFSIPGVYDVFTSYVFQQRFLNIWFITCLFLLEILFYILKRYIKNDTIISLLSIVSVVIGYYYYKLGGFSIYWNADACLMALPFFTFGYLSRKHDLINIIKSKPALKVSMMIGLLTINLVLWSYSYKYSETLDMFFNRYGIIPITYVAAFVGILFMVLFSTVTKSRCIMYIGKNSMLYFFWHQFFLLFLNDVFELLKFEETVSSLSIPVISEHVYLLACILKTVIVIIIVTVLNELILKSKFKFVLGK